MIKIGAIKVLVSNCITGVYLRWWFNGWHYFLFTNGYEISMRTESLDTQVTNYFSVISKIERPTKLKAEFDYKITVEGIRPEDVSGFLGLLMAEKVEQYEGAIWREVNIPRGDHLVREEGGPGYVLNFEITRDELPGQSSVMKKSMKLYIDDVLCDIDDDEPIPVNKQVNDIAEMQDRQSDYTAQFSIRKTRLMKDLFELSGEVGINTDFPYETHYAKLINDGIEIITNGRVLLDKGNDQYYKVAIYSGNADFFKTIDGLNIDQLDLTALDHVWSVANMVATHAADLGYVYPLIEPSNDGGIAPLTDTGDTVEMYGGWIRAFVKLKYVFDKIISEAGYTSEGNILTDELFLKMFMPLTNLNVDYVKTDALMYNVFVENTRLMDSPTQDLLWGAGYGATVTSYKGSSLWRNGSQYYTKYAGDYTFRLKFGSYNISDMPTNVYLYVGGVNTSDMPQIGFSMYLRNGRPYWHLRYEVTLTLLASVSVHWRVTYCKGVSRYSVEVTNITGLKLALGSDVPIANHIADISQKEFVKMICNLFGLIPDATVKDKKIKFWNYQELYDNIPNARDWSAYLSERDDEVEFKFGAYAQKNYLRYKDSDDVIKDTGIGSMDVHDETLQATKDVVKIPFATCDEVSILDDIFHVNVSRIDMNIFNADTAVYDENLEIDPRIVYIDNIAAVSPPDVKQFGIRPTVAPGGATWITSPKKASSAEVSLSRMVGYYDSLARMLTKTNLRRAKFNLPVYEVAGLKHYIPIYLRQYKAYFYVNKINNYVPGKLCTIDLIKL